MNRYYTGSLRSGKVCRVTKLPLHQQITSRIFFAGFGEAKSFPATDIMRQATSEPSPLKHFPLRRVPVLPTSRTDQTPRPKQQTLKTCCGCEYDQCQKVFALPNYRTLFCVSHVLARECQYDWRTNARIKPLTIEYDSFQQSICVIPFNTNAS